MRPLVMFFNFTFPLFVLQAGELDNSTRPCAPVSDDASSRVAQTKAFRSPRRPRTHIVSTDQAVGSPPESPSRLSPKLLSPRAERKQAIAQDHTYYFADAGSAGQVVSPCSTHHQHALGKTTLLGPAGPHGGLGGEGLHLPKLRPTGIHPGDVFGMRYTQQARESTDPATIRLRLAQIHPAHPSGQAHPSASDNSVQRQVEEKHKSSAAQEGIGIGTAAPAHPAPNSATEWILDETGMFGRRHSHHRVHDSTSHKVFKRVRADTRRVRADTEPLPRLVHRRDRCPKRSEYTKSKADVSSWLASGRNSELMRDAVAAAYNTKMLPNGRLHHLPQANRITWPAQRRPAYP